MVGKKKCFLKEPNFNFSRKLLKLKQLYITEPHTQSGVLGVYVVQRNM